MNHLPLNQDGLLFYIPKPTPATIARAITRHLERFGCEPTVCYARTTDGIEAGQLEVRQANNVLSGHIWIGRLE